MGWFRLRTLFYLAVFEHDIYCYGQTMTEKNDPASKTMPLSEHLRELRARVIRCLVLVACAFVLCVVFSEEIYLFLVYPFSEEKNPITFYYELMAEGVMVQLKIGLYSAIFISLPYIILQAFYFISPGLKPNERKMAITGMLVCSVMFLAGITVFYALILPALVPGLRSFNFQGVGERYILKDNLAFILKMLLGFGIAFQLPIVLYILVRTGVLPIKMLQSNRRYVIVILLVISAVLTPQDVWSQLMMVGPLYLMFEATLIVCRMGGKKNV